MDEKDLDLTNLVGVSGRFLSDPAKFERIHALWLEYGKLAKELRDVEIDRRHCNDPVWLRTRARQWRRLGKDPKAVLPAFVEQLEGKKSQLTARMEGLKKQITDLEPTWPDSFRTETLAWPTGKARRGRKQADGVVERNALIYAHKNESALAICKLLDDQFPAPGQGRPPAQLPDTWFRTYGVTTFSEALTKCPRLVYSMISRAKMKSHSP